MSLKSTLPFATFVTGALLSAAGTALVLRWSTRRGFVDIPGGHKGHARPVALGGGVAITLAAVIPMLCAIAAANLFGTEAAPAWVPESVRIHLGGMLTKTPLALALAGAAAFICMVGLMDDRRAMRPLTKLVAQVAAAATLVIGFNLRLLSDLGYVPSVLLSILWIVTLMNSFNFLDNMDGLAAGVAMIAASVFASTAMRAGQIFVPACCLLLAGALAGFLPFNVHPARVFMGDAGSMVIGLLIGVLTILTTFADPAQGQAPVGVLAPLVVMAVPLYDTASVIWIRWRCGSPIWAGDRRHFSHRLVRRGMPVRQAVAVIWLATLVTSLPALMLPRASWPLAWGILLQTLLVVALVALLESAGGDGSD